MVRLTQLKFFKNQAIIKRDKKDREHKRGELKLKEKEKVLDYSGSFGEEEHKKNDYSGESSQNKELLEYKVVNKENFKSVGNDDNTIIEEENQIKSVYDFFELLYPDNVKGEIGIWDIKSKKTLFIDVRDKEKVEIYVDKLVNEEKDVYFNVSLQNKNLAIKKRMNSKQIKRKLIESIFKKIFFDEYKKEKFLMFDYEEEKELLNEKGKKMTREKEFEYQKNFLSLEEKSNMIQKVGKRNKDLIKKHYDEQASYTRGSSYTTESSFGIWLDIDIDIKGHHKQNSNQFSNFKDAYTFIMELDIKPTLIIKSGGGYHIYYVLEKVVTYKSDEERKNFEDLVKKVVLSIRKNAEKNNGEGSIDTTFDLARLLRIPFTKNFKDSNNPKNVEIVYQSNKRYTISEFKDFIIDDIDKTVSKPRKEIKVTNKEKKSFKMKIGNEIIEYISNPSKDTLANAELMYKGCAFIKHCVDNPNDISYGEWLAMLQTVIVCENGEDYAHKWSEGYSDYDEYETDMMVDSISHLKPVTHDRIINELGFNECSDSKCGEFHSPIALGYKKNHK
ncbi:hypothetical protein [Virgibacillus sp. DJP39]|uniref:hypothetical protein n=1 Tax=Virgibacillus sp. DJP39 TaxID=3409790 RepID=UPI003BB7970F